MIIEFSLRENGYIIMDKEEVEYLESYKKRKERVKKSNNTDDID